MSGPFDVIQHSLIGGRKTNQDRIGHAYTSDALLMVVADGMGGHLHGEIAAEIAVRVLLEHFKREARGKLTNPGLFLRLSLEAAHETIGKYVITHNLDEYPRTTCVACVVQNNTAYWCHAGDSRLYLLRKGRLYKRTRDHSRVQRMIDSGLLREDQALTHPDRNRVYSCLGGDQLPTITLSEGTLINPGDQLILCSDGFWGVLTTTEIESGFSDESLKIALPKLIQKALVTAGSHGDNLSVVAVEWPGARDKLEYIDSAVTMPADYLTRPMGAPSGQSKADDMSDEEIERAIVEIQTAIQKYTK